MDLLSQVPFKQPLPLEGFDWLLLKGVYKMRCPNPGKDHVHSEARSSAGLLEKDGLFPQDCALGAGMRE